MATGYPDSKKYEYIPLKGVSTVYSIVASPLTHLDQFIYMK
jgi:hypothetical protein